MAGLAKLLKAFWGSDSRTRYEARYELIRSLAHRNGFRIYNKNLFWHYDADYLAAWAGFPDNKGGNSVHERRFALFNLARALRPIAGDIAECGLFKGAGSYLMLAASRGTGKHLYGFDSFAGLSQPQKEDMVKRPEAFRWQEADLTVPKDEVVHNLASFGGKYTLYEGWIPDRFEAVESLRFSLVHIDVDLYEPTLASAEFFFPRLSPGGLIICDDYGFNTCPGATKAMDELAERYGTHVAHLPTGQGLLFKNKDG